MQREPLVTTAFLTALVAAVLGLLTAFGLDLSDDQQKAILALVAILAPVVVAVIVRPKVTPVE